MFAVLISLASLLGRAPAAPFLFNGFWPLGLAAWAVLIIGVNLLLMFPGERRLWRWLRLGWVGAGAGERGSE